MVIKHKKILKIESLIKEYEIEGYEKNEEESIKANSELEKLESLFPLNQEIIKICSEYD